MSAPDAPRPARRPRSAKQARDRARREQRELARELQERAVREVIPARDDGPAPRID